MQPRRTHPHGQWAGLTTQLKETPPQLPSNQDSETLTLQHLEPALLLE